MQDGANGSSNNAAGDSTAGAAPMDDSTYLSSLPPLIPSGSASNSPSKPSMRAANANGANANPAVDHSLSKSDAQDGSASPNRNASANANLHNAAPNGEVAQIQPPVSFSNKPIDPIFLSTTRERRPSS